MIDKHLMLAISALAALAPGAAGGQELDYTYVEASYLNLDLEAGPGTIDGDGLGLTGSLLLQERFFVFADYGRANFERGIDTSGYDLGFGHRWPLQPRLDAYAELAWVHSRIETDFASADDDGYAADVGLRSRLGDKVELQGAITYVDVGGSDTSLRLGGRYYLTDEIAIGAGYEVNNDGGGWNVSLRAEFGH